MTNPERLTPSSPPAIDIAAELRALRDAIHEWRDTAEDETATHADALGMMARADAIEARLLTEYTRQAARIAELEDDVIAYTARSVLARVFDDVDEVMAEWEAFDKSGWFTPERALGAFIRIRLDRRRTGGSQP